MVDNLAIVIPAYKTRYLDDALSSIAAQTDKNFKVYVCDDGSPENIKAIADKYATSFNLIYHRFPDNAGRYDLVKHWNRSVEVAGEDWIWLFSDDDIMSPGCVKAVNETLQATNGLHYLHRFDIEMINAQGEVIAVKEPHPQQESAFEFLTRRLQSRSLSAAVEYIFRKDIFYRQGGFVKFPLAYCSDDASWISFAGDKPIHTIHTGKVYWRQSGINISSAKGLQDKKADALLGFIQFIKEKYPHQQALLTQLAEPWFYENIRYLQGKLSPLKFISVWIKITRMFHRTSGYTLKKLVASQLQHTRFASSTQKWLK